LLVTKIVVALWELLRSLLGPQYFGRKLATVAFAVLVGFFMFARGDYEIGAPATIEGSIQRTVVAPFNGYLASEGVRAGSLVRAGQMMATLDDQDLLLERLRLTTERGQHLTEYDQALAKQDRAQASIVKSQIDQVEAQLSLIDQQLARTRITAPFDGVVVSGDLSQSVGATVERGQELFKIAPLDAYRVILKVDEADIADVHAGQTGVLRVASLPDKPLSYRIERVTPIADQREGRNFFHAEASLDEVDDRLRPSMEGVARTFVDERLLFRIWTRRPVNWLRLAIWRWEP
jgi:multidrug efflux pump subunit AcrA (membrane-fusion protein)